MPGDTSMNNDTKHKVNPYDEFQRVLKELGDIHADAKATLESVKKLQDTTLGQSLQTELERVCVRTQASEISELTALIDPEYAEETNPHVQDILAVRLERSEVDTEQPLPQVEKSTKDDE